MVISRRFHVLQVFLSFLVVYTLAQEDQLLDIIGGCGVPKPEEVDKFDPDCSRRREFPEESFTKELKDKDNTVYGEITDSYKEPSLDESSCPHIPVEQNPATDETKADDKANENANAASERQKRLIAPILFNLCPFYHYIIYKWWINLARYGGCWIVTPIHVINCHPKHPFCYYVGPWPFFRCRPVYRRHFYVAYCPKANKKRLFYTYAYIASGCCCQRYVCYHGVY